MKVLHVIDYFQNPFSGVANIFPEHLLAQAKFAEVAYMNLRNVSFSDQVPRIEYQRNTFFSNLCNLFGIPDIVVFHEIYRMEYLFLSRFFTKKRIPYIIIPHGSLTKNAQNKKKLKKTVANVFFFNRFIDGANAIQYLSKAENASSCHENIPSFIGTNGVHFPSKVKNSFSANCVKIIYVGRLDIYHKGLDLLVEATKNCRVLFQEQKIHISIYGHDESGKFQIMNLVERAGITDLISIHREVVKQEKEQILLEGDVFIQTSRFEGMPLGLLDALSYGLPCIVTQGTTLGDLVRQYDAGWVADNTPSSIADCLKKMSVEKKLWMNKSKNAIRLVEENFDWSVIAKQTIENYEAFI